MNKQCIHLNTPTESKKKKTHFLLVIKLKIFSFSSAFISVYRSIACHLILLTKYPMNQWTDFNNSNLLRTLSNDRYKGKICREDLSFLRLDECFGAGRALAPPVAKLLCLCVALPLDFDGVCLGLHVGTRSSVSRVLLLSPEL